MKYGGYPCTLIPVAKVSQIMQFTKTLPGDLSRFKILRDTINISMTNLNVTDNHEDTAVRSFESGMLLIEFCTKRI